MQAWTFTIPGQPIPKGRPKHMKNGHTYTPARTVDGEAAVAAAFREQVVGYGPPRPGRFKLTCHFYMARDDSDMDNLFKLVMDGLQGIVWLNDKQVKQFGESSVEVDHANPRTEVSIFWLG